MEEVLRLPYFQPSGPFGPIEVNDPAVRSGGKNNKPLFLNAKAASKIRTESAYREILQNLVDGVVEANGESFFGIKVTRVTRKGKDVVLFHTDTHILGEIVVETNKISFVNMGPKIRSVEQILQFGASEKESKKNQAGQHGEGLKRAALKFLSRGFRVEAFFAIDVDQETEFRHLTFKMSDKHKCLAFSLAPVNPFERFSGSADYHRFEVVIQTGSQVPVFDIEAFMLIKEEHLRGPRTQEDQGSILFGETERGEVYVWHFFVAAFEKMLFGYDLFLQTITRDRDNIRTESLCESIAAIWSQEIIRDAVLAKRFFTDVLMNPNVEDCMELWSLSRFSAKARAVLFELFKDGKDIYPILQSQLHLIRSQFRKKRFVVVPKHAYNFFAKSIPKLETLLETFLDTFRNAPSVELVCPILMPTLRKFFSSVEVVFSNENNEDIQPVIFCVTDVIGSELKTLRICHDEVKSMVTEEGIVTHFEELCDCLFFSIRIFPEDFVGGLKAVTEILERQKALALPEPVILHIVPDKCFEIDEEDENNDQENDDQEYQLNLKEFSDEDEEDEEDEAPVIRRKRNREEAPPDGYEYYQGPPLLIKKK
jgi:hypothetical protein